MVQEAGIEIYFIHFAVVFGVFILNTFFPKSYKLLCVQFSFLFVTTLYFYGIKSVSRNDPPIMALVGNEGSAYDNSNFDHLSEAKCGVQHED
jgi:ABC-type Fe3+-siderophore transport system permease subunit